PYFIQATSLGSRRVGWKRLPKFVDAELIRRKYLALRTCFPRHIWFPSKAMPALLRALEAQGRKMTADGGEHYERASFQSDQPYRDQLWVSLSGCSAAHHSRRQD